METRDTKAIVALFKKIEKKSDEKKNLLVWRETFEQKDQALANGATYSAWQKALKEKRLPSIETFLSWQNTVKTQEFSLPLGIVDLDAFDRNVEKLAASVAGTEKTIRIATKSIRNPWLIQRVLNKGKPFVGVMCYSVKEAEYLHHLGINDFLIAYPTVQKSDARILQKLQAAGAKTTVVLDSSHQMEILDKHLKDIANDTPLRVAIDIDMSYLLVGSKLGALRSPVFTEEDLYQVLIAAKRFSSLKIVGMMGYEAVVAGLPDRKPAAWYAISSQILNYVKSWIRGKAVSDIAERRAKFTKLYSLVIGAQPEIFNGGGTGSLDSTVKEKELTEVTAGSGLLCPHTFDNYSNLNSNSAFRFDPALYFAVQETRYPNSHSMTVNFGGYVASGEVGKDKLPLSVYPPRLALTDDEACGEVQTPLIVATGEPRQKLGHAVFFRPAKGEVAERFDGYYLSQDGAFVGEAATYRGMGYNFG